MTHFTKYFFRGLLVVVPVALTVYIIFFVLVTVDGWLGFKTRWLGLLVAAISTILVTTLIGLLVSNVLGRRAVNAMEKVLGKLPVVKLLYSSLKDLLNAFVGERRSFEKPVVVDVGGETKALGFITCERFDDPQLEDHVAVYLPQSYNFAGNLIVVPRARVKTIDALGSQFMAFIVSGGVAELSAAQTLYEQPLFKGK